MPQVPWQMGPKMDSPPKLTGETLIVHHIPLVHCQVPDRQRSSTSQGTNPFFPSDLGVRRTSSLPERTLLQADSLVYSSLLRASDGAPEEEPVGGQSPSPTLAAPAAPRRQNPFLLRDGEAWDLCEDDLGQKSFHLHDGRSAFRLHEPALPPFHLHSSSPVVRPWGGSHRMDVVEGCTGLAADEEAQDKGHIATECMELDEYSCHRGDPSSLSLEQEWASESDDLMNNTEVIRSRTCSCSNSELQRCRCYSLSSQSEPLDQQMGYVSDSSCNSSDGILVNFSTLYQRRHGHPHTNLNSGPLSCDSSSGSQSDMAAFYLDLHSSSQESKMPGELQDLEGPGKSCGCHHPSSPVLDANCNSYPPLCDPCPSDGSDLTACFQSQARLVVATQNYYKLVTCDLSSQSSPSPPGSSITSCSEEQARGSPLQPTEYYLFQRPEESDTEGSRDESQEESEKNAIEGQVYINVSPPSLAGGRQRSRSYDRHLDRSPSSRLGSLERMLSCPVKLSDSSSLTLQSSPPKRVTSFAELAKGRKKNGSSPPIRTSRDSSLEFSPIPEGQRDSSVFLESQERHSQSLPPLPLARSEGEDARKAPSFREVPTCGQEGDEQLFFSAVSEMGAGGSSIFGQKDIRARADGGAADGKVVRYSKDQRPTTLPIQPFVFQHHFPKPAKGRALHSHLASSLSQLYSLSAATAARPASQPPSSASQSSTSTEGPMGQGQRSADGAVSLGDGHVKRGPGPETTRLSPLGSYSPVRNNVPFFQSGDSSSCSPTPETQPPRSKSCPVSANLLPSTKASPAAGSCATPGRPGTGVQHKQCESPSPVAKKEEPPGPSAPLAKDRLPVGSLLPLLSGGWSLPRAESHSEPQWKIGGSDAASFSSLGVGIPRPLNANHLSLQALKWREYRRRNPLGLDRVSDLAGLTSHLDWKQLESKPPWRNPLLAMPVGHSGPRLHGPAVKEPQQSFPDFFPDCFSLAEKPPAEFCLSPDGNTESVSVDLLQKKGLVKAINMSVDLIVAHFGTSRDPGVKAKLGNSSVSPNVGHLVLKYLCPAIRDVLSDGLKAYVLDVIVGQRRNVPWSIVEASTQLGPSTKVLHSLYSRVSQYPELTSHNMRFNAFIFGLLNIRSLEFWFNHLYNHEDVLQAHYQPMGFLPLAHGACQGLFEELLLLLQPLSLLPFGLDLLFEHHLLQVGRWQQQQKELLRGQQGLLLSAHSTLQLMHTHGAQRAGEGSRGPTPLERAAEPAKGAPELKKDRQASWWLQLTQSSQVYIQGSPEGARLAHHERKKRAWARSAEAGKGPPPREGVVEGAEACPPTEAPPVRERLPAEEAKPSWKPGPPAGEEIKDKGRPFWMGSPPDAVLAELKRSREQDQATAPGKEQPITHVSSSGQPKWAHLFGSRQASKESKQANRLPSGWLSLDRSVFQLMAQTVGASVWREAEMAPKQLPVAEGQRSDGRASPGAPWAVKALCHHIATEAGQLSFKRGDVLRVLSRVDADWLRCSRREGAESGLVPIMYVTHLEDADY
ncbi:AP-4 complex accessory subunit RUSC2 isoform X3 [Ahaetulla prasina]|uniref:AP-4 complex accessory subunit RUSC2 isoform X3 n=1 Tax=Ahaetulla prasina TaxID=499056 RepID=UPI00264817AC|nr:AP-4 complex accessory subunit RUSC2 isoform X3 [Ahaetulla prasina]